MFSFHLRRFFATSTKFANFGQIKGASVTKLSKEEVKSLLKENNLKKWKFGSHQTFLDIHQENDTQHSQGHIGEHHDSHRKTQSHISRTFVFQDHKQAFEFMDAMSRIIDTVDHHPEWQLVDREVDVKLNTHDAGNSVSQKDILLARTMDYVSEHVSKTDTKFSITQETEELNLDDVFQKAIVAEPRQEVRSEQEEKERKLEKRDNPKVAGRQEGREKPIVPEGAQPEAPKKSDKAPAEKKKDKSGDHYSQTSNL